MIELYYWPTPNGHKVTMLLEEAGLDYAIRPVNISAGDQFKPEFLAFSPNNRMPAIIDGAPADGGEAVTVFESGAILVYLAEKTCQFLPADLRGRKTVLEWVFWQMGGLGPMAGQNHHFAIYAPEKLAYAISRYVNETKAVWRVGPPPGRQPLPGRRCLLDCRHGRVSLGRAVEAAGAGLGQLSQRAALVRRNPGTPGHCPRLRPRRGVRQPAVTEEGKKLLFGQTAATASMAGAVPHAMRAATVATSLQTS